VITNANLAGAYRRWAPDELERLEEVRRREITRAELAAAIGRSFKAVKRKLCP
jgi:hypothetical protein